MEGLGSPQITNMKISQIISEHTTVLKGVSTLIPDIERAAIHIQQTLQRGGKMLICGNGGSAADAQHIAGEFVGRFLRERNPWPAVALHTNTSIVTAIGNDYGFDLIFARQVKALGNPGDVLVGITTSGNSCNIVKAAEVAKERNMKIIGMTGEGGGYLKEKSDVCLCVPSKSTPRIQEMHILIGHIICQLVEEALC